MIPFFDTEPIIWIGGQLISPMLAFADFLTGFYQTDNAINTSTNVYPGQAHCKHEQGHSIWHEVTSSGVLDVMYLCDHVNTLIGEQIPKQ